jgi:hypothetical protein
MARKRDQAGQAQLESIDGFAELEREHYIPHEAMKAWLDFRVTASTARDRIRLWEISRRT